MCPIFLHSTNITYIVFHNPDKKEFEEFEKTYQDTKIFQILKLLFYHRG